ncbi:putative protein TPRXL [Portunus trituberculatus]|uniref:putative protein TPRXL n=1 Tax=Portunus trituberculatus TaxID=210409 RepID=UPI001E1D0728|nr:putative protein TPRXL [Portunus trituberculatus]
MQPCRVVVQLLVALLVSCGSAWANKTQGALLKPLNEKTTSPPHLPLNTVSRPAEGMGRPLLRPHNTTSRSSPSPIILPDSSGSYTSGSGYTGSGSASSSSMLNIHNDNRVDSQATKRPLNGGNTRPSRPASSSLKPVNSASRTTKSPSRPVRPPSKPSNFSLKPVNSPKPAISPSSSTRLPSKSVTTSYKPSHSNSPSRPANTPHNSSSPSNSPSRPGNTPYKPSKPPNSSPKPANKPFKPFRPSSSPSQSSRPASRPTRPAALTFGSASQPNRPATFPSRLPPGLAPQFLQTVATPAPVTSPAKAITVNLNLGGFGLGGSKDKTSTAHQPKDHMDQSAATVNECTSPFLLFILSTTIVMSFC